ncbi:hypothetical protein BSLG_010720 [Batrachochytrium salamandrivorans]|nr:hypothetical protein BSLG_010720 [Batrachochytrium salamandrivorans]
MFGPALTLVLALASSAVIAAPTADNVYERAVASLNPLSTVLPFHFPESVYENIPHSGAASSSFSGKDDVKTAADFISKKLNLGANDFKVVDSYTDAVGVTHVYGAHILNGARIANHQAAAHVKNGEVTSFSSSFGTAQHLAKRDLAVSEPKATLDFAKASATASAQLGIPVYSESEHTLEYVEQPDGKIVYAYKLQLRNNPVTKWVEVWCDATTGKVVQAVDFANKASYKAIPLPRRDANEGFSMVSNPEFWVLLQVDGLVARPLGFNSRGAPGTDANLAAAAVNLFYVSNVMHDISYQYGFTESAGNFKRTTLARADKAMTLSDEHISFTYTTPNRTPGFDNSVIIHEYAHGISNRLTGGPSTASCLNKADSAGMGEGWSDIMAMMVLAKSSDTATTRVTIGAYIANNAAGEVWASMLWEVYWNLVAKHGFSANLHDASQSAGNVVAMKIIIGGMALQPCNPGFIDARNAIITADVNHYGGANKCEIIKAFAKRGLGSEANNLSTNDFSVPSECQ